MPYFEIRSWHLRGLGDPLFWGDYPNMRACVEDAVRLRGELRFADLRFRDLTNIDFGAADLRYSNMFGACAVGANFGGALLDGANLQQLYAAGAWFGCARLTGARTHLANFRGVDLAWVALPGKPDGIFRRVIRLHPLRVTPLTLLVRKLGWRRKRDRTVLLGRRRCPAGRLLLLKLGSLFPDRRPFSRR